MINTPKANANIKKTHVEYKFENTVMEGYVAFDDSIKTSQPAILIVHDWMGPGSFTNEKVEQLAHDGYVAFAVDVYGKNIRPKNSDEAAKLATLYKSNRNLLRSHMNAAYQKLISMKEVNPKNVVVMGYCFGGTSALELARSGAPVIGTVSFHGGLSSPTPNDAKNIKGKVLAMHGADDPFVPATEVAAFKDEMKNAKIEMKFVQYPGAVHSFTNKAAGNDNSKGAAYNALADKKSWLEFQTFLAGLKKNQ
jgi:dienelactone hydrolase